MSHYELRALLLRWALLFAVATGSGWSHAATDIDARSVTLGSVSQSYCTSIDGVDYNSTQYFKSAADVLAKTGLTIQSQNTGNACCTAAKPWNGAACAAPLICPSGQEVVSGVCKSTTTSCAAIGQILGTSGSCVVLTPVAASDFSTSNYCIHTVAFSHGAQGSIEYTQYFIMDVIDSSYTYLGANSTGKACTSKNAPGFFSGQTATQYLRKTTTSIRYAPAAATYYLQGGQGSSVVSFLKFPITKAKQFGCAYKDGGVTPSGATFITKQINSNSVTTGPLPSGWSIYYNANTASPKPVIGTVWIGGVTNSFGGAGPVQANYSGGQLISSSCQATPGGPVGYLAVDNVVILPDPSTPMAATYPSSMSAMSMYDNLAAYYAISVAYAATHSNYVLSNYFPPDYLTKLRSPNFVNGHGTFVYDPTYSGTSSPTVVTGAVTYSEYSIIVGY